MIDECNNAHQNKLSYFQPGAGMSNANMVLIAIINPGTIPIVTTQLTSTTTKYLYKGGVMRPGRQRNPNWIRCVHGEHCPLAGQGSPQKSIFLVGYIIAE